MVALQETDAFLAQQRRLLGGLDAFRDSAEPETAGQAEQVAQNDPVFAAAREAADKGALDIPFLILRYPIESCTNSYPWHS